MSVETNEVWPLMEEGAGEREWRRGQTALPLDLIDRLRRAKVEADAEILRRGQELHDLRNELHAARIQLFTRDAEITRLRSDLERVGRSQTSKNA